MQWFAVFLIAAFGKLFDFFLQFVGKKVALGTAAIATALALLTAFYISMKLLVAGLMSQVTNEYLLMGFYVLWPSNAEICLSAYWTAHLFSFIYREHRENLRMLATIS